MNPTIQNTYVDNEPGTWREEIDLDYADPLPDPARNHAKQAAKDHCLYLQRYFNDQVP